MARKRGYGQFCPIAKAAEILAERWTFLIARELVYGSRRFSELRRGVPQMSPSLLSRRLVALEDAGVIVRHKGRGPRGVGWEYHLTPAGEELRPIIEQLAVWGQRWTQRQIRRGDLDPLHVMWTLHRGLRTAALPRPRAVIRFELPAERADRRSFWLLVDGSDVDLCVQDPAYDVDVTVRSDVKTLTEIYLGHVAPDAAVRARRVTLDGTPAFTRAFSRWCPRAPIADIERPIASH